MSIEILMPALSPTMKEGNLAKWLIKKGDKVKAGDVIAEIETDKATMELETLDEGIVKELLFKEGTQSIKVNTPIAIIEDVSLKKITNDIVEESDQKLSKQKNNNFFIIPSSTASISIVALSVSISATMSPALI